MKTLNVLGGAGYVPPSDKVNIAFIDVGAQGLRVMLRFLRETMSKASPSVTSTRPTRERETEREYSGYG